MCQTKVEGFLGGKTQSDSPFRLERNEASMLEFILIQAR